LFLLFFFFFVVRCFRNVESDFVVAEIGSGGGKCGENKEKRSSSGFVFIANRVIGVFSFDLPFFKTQK